jgi:hypothetical protein
MAYIDTWKTEAEIDEYLKKKNVVITQGVKDDNDQYQQ